MQKKLIALAVAGLASTGAFAQANVTVYGIADGSFDVVRVSNTNGNTDLGNTTRVSSNSSYVGFKGAEALGNGLTAVFQFESGVSFDSKGGLSTSRDSFVGLSSANLGTVVLGNLTGPTRALGTTLDVNAGAAGIGANSALLGKLGNNLIGGTDANTNYTPATGVGRSATSASIFDTRWSNAIAYVSPTYYGLNATVAYVANENKSFHNTTNSPINTSGYDLGLKYANGPILAAVTYNAVSLGNDAGTNVSDLRIGGSYDFGIATVRAIFDRTRGDHLTAIGLGAGKATQNVFGLGGTFNVTPAGKVLAQAYFANDLKLDGSSASDTGAKFFELGYEHSLSKRTMLKAAYVHLNNDNNARYDFGNNAAGLGTVGTSATGATLQGVQLGLRHSF